MLSNRSETDKHICNRYCGGSHTVTTPAQRVARTGHFVKQWGPDVLPLTSGLAAGDDGKVNSNHLQMMIFTILAICSRGKGNVLSRYMVLANSPAVRRFFFL